MAYLTPEELRARYPKGTVVRAKASELDHWQPAFATKLKDRLGEVVGHTFPYSKPIIVYPAEGRRKELRQAFDYMDSYFDIVTDEKEIAAWRKAVADTAARAEKNRLKKQQAAKAQSE